jgi:hypothetical protein
LSRRFLRVGKNLPGFFHFRENRKKPKNPYFWLPQHHLNAHSSFVMQHMAMNFAPLDCSCQGVSSESKKIYLDFFILEKIAKNQKIIFLAPTAKNGFNGWNFYYT